MSDDNQSTIDNISNTYENAKGSLTNTFDDFSTKATVGVAASSGFLNSNTLIAKFAFILLVLIVFLFLINLGITIIHYFPQASTDPYIINGLISGSTAMIVSQNPKNAESKNGLKK